MTTRDQIVRTALGFNGTCNGKGYNGPNPFSADLSRPAEAWCGDYVLMLKSPMMTGADVRVVQQALNQRNHAGLATDGAYGPATRDAVLNWQRHAHIEADGIVGPQTRSSLGLPA